MSAAIDEIGATHYTVREVVGVFATDSALETAVEQLELAGVSRHAISVLGVGAPPSGRIDVLYRSAREIADDPAARRTAFVDHRSRAQGEVFAIALPAQIGGFAGAWAVAAAGGALVTAIGVTILGGVVGAGVGGLLLLAVARHHAGNIESQLTHGGLVLWVSSPDEAEDRRVVDVLQLYGGMSVHTHTIEREWGVADTPLHDIKLDPLLQ